MCVFVDCSFFNLSFPLLYKPNTVKHSDFKNEIILLYRVDKNFIEKRTKTHYLPMKSVNA